MKLRAAFFALFMLITQTALAWNQCMVGHQDPHTSNYQIERDSAGKVLYNPETDCNKNQDGWPDCSYPIIKNSRFEAGASCDMYETDDNLAVLWPSKNDKDYAYNVLEAATQGTAKIGFSCTLTYGRERPHVYGYINHYNANGDQHTQMWECYFP